MSNVSINRDQLISEAEHIRQRINDDIIEYSKTQGEAMISCFQQSSGEFADIFRNDVRKEMETVVTVGETLIAVLDYILAASENFARIDQSYNNSKIQ